MGSAQSRQDMHHPSSSISGSSFTSLLLRLILTGAQSPNVPHGLPHISAGGCFLNCGMYTLPIPFPAGIVFTGCDGDICPGWLGASQQ
jgi:hypothetical protein